MNHSKSTILFTCFYFYFLPSVSYPLIFKGFHRKWIQNVQTSKILLSKFFNMLHYRTELIPRLELQLSFLFDKLCRFAFQDDEFNEIIKSSRRIEFLYGHWFDEVIVNADLLVAFEQLLQVVHKIENEPLWVPASWVQ